LDELRSNIVNNKSKLKDEIPVSYQFDYLFDETVPKLMNLISDDREGVQWYIEICFNYIDATKKFQKRIYPGLEKKNCDSYFFQVKCSYLKTLIGLN